MERGGEDAFLAARLAMVETQLRARDIRHEGVLSAFASVPRHRFVPVERLGEAYEDYPLPIGMGQTISQPYIVALMVQSLNPRAHHRVLDVGAGSGYQSAILARLVKHVYAVERLGPVLQQAKKTLAGLGVENVSFREGDGCLGWAEEAPFDGIVCGAAAMETPRAWLEQLAEGGRIAVPLGGEVYQTLMLLEKVGGRIVKRELCDVRFVKLIGEGSWNG